MATMSKGTLAEVRRVRKAVSAEFGHDVDRIWAYYCEQQAKLSAPTVGAEARVLAPRSNGAEGVAATRADGQPRRRGRATRN